MHLGHGLWEAVLAAMAVFWALVVVASIWILRSLATQQEPQGHTPIDALDSSFARGEISAEEYRERRDALEL